MPKPKPSARLSKQERAARLRDVEELLVRGVANRTIYAQLGPRWGVKDAQVRKFIREVRAVWAAEAAEIDRTEVRAQHRSRLSKVFERAMARRVTVKNADGTVVLNARGEPVTMEMPDLRSSMRALDSLARLDNLNEETVKVDAPAESLVDLMRMGAVMAKRDPKHRPLGRLGKNGANGHGANGANGNGKA